MTKRIIFCSIWALLTFASASADTLDSLLTVLESEVTHSDLYIARKQARIDSLCAVRPMTPALQLRIAQEYQHFQSDSSRAWFLKLQDADEPIRTEAFIGMVKLLASSGHYSNATALLDKEGMPSISSVEGYKMAWLLYSDAAANAQVPLFQDEAKERAQQYYDSMMVALEKMDKPYSMSRRETSINARNGSFAPPSPTCVAASPTTALPGSWRRTVLTTANWSARTT